MNMAEVSITKARDELAELLNRAAYGKERVVLTRHGKRLVAIIPVEDLEMLEALDDRLDSAAAEQALRDSEGQARIPWEKVKEELGLAGKRTTGRSRVGAPLARPGRPAGRPRSRR
ncbi:type II toxin-antitoxin system Phd/YefM family antitoxin [Pyxidicoccus trucidator]|uniref:type II toxin-antitoxin system Phd/YefM family antitoxin n=1 Tax=Pyxidicoccus trucidator TaxID=2709662 RepID=UPI003B836F7C